VDLAGEPSNRTASAEDLLNAFAKEDSTTKGFRPYRTAWQKSAFWAMAGLLAAAVAGLVLAYFVRRPWAHILLLTLLILTQCAAIVYQLALMLPGLREMVDAPSKTFLAPILNRTSIVRARIDALSRHPEWQLEILEEHLRLENSQMRSRLLLVAGPVETLGVLPAMAGTAAAFHGLGATWAAQSNGTWFDAAFVVLTGLYVIALVGVFVSHQADHYLMLVRMARKAREGRERSPSGGDSRRGST
jgi:hypothetical protein